MERLNLDALMDLVNQRTQSVIEIDLAGATLQVCDAESLPQRFRLNLARAQASLQDYYAEVIREQNEIQVKLEDETLSSTQRVALQKEATEVAVSIALKMFSASEYLLDANIQYIESVAQMDQGQLMERINDLMDEKSIVGDRRDVVSAMLVARTSQLIRAAMDDAEKNFQEQVARTVRIQSAGGQLSAVVPIVEASTSSAANAKKLKNTSAAAS